MDDETTRITVCAYDEDRPTTHDSSPTPSLPHDRRDGGGGDGMDVDARAAAHVDARADERTHDR